MPVERHGGRWPRYRLRYGPESIWLILLPSHSAQPVCLAGGSRKCPRAPARQDIAIQRSGQSVLDGARPYRSVPVDWWRPVRFPFAPFDAIHLGQELRYHSIAHIAIVAAAPPWGQRIDLVEEDEAGSSLLCATKNLAYPFLRLTNPFGKQLWPFDGDEAGLALIRQGAGDQGFTRSGRSREEYAARRFDLRVGVNLWEAEGPFNPFCQRIFNILQAADIIPGSLAHLDVDFSRG